jgi:iron-sulfur cluster repair protein YtfE (RIC family)
MNSETSRPPKLDNVDAYLSWDHDRLDGLLRALCEGLVGGPLEAARDRCRAFGEGLACHIRREEELLFPVIGARTNAHGGGLIEAMRQDHRILLQVLAVMRGGLDAQDLPRFGAALEVLQEVLPSHSAREKRLLYPLIDRLLAEEERSVFTEKLKRI